MRGDQQKSDWSPVRLLLVTALQLVNTSQWGKNILRGGKRAFKGRAKIY